MARTKDDVMVFDGVVKNSNSGIFTVYIPATDSTVTAKLSGKIRLNSIRVVVDDRVSIEVSTLDPSKGRITQRLNPNYRR